ncbi:hypothetical protein TNCV_4482131 [Trichonephila clavipes]|nr:hypothetical protein TNCV_4482131 [Trichonephila clavipes]
MDSSPKHAGQKNLTLTTRLTRAGTHNMANGIRALLTVGFLSSPVSGQIPPRNVAWGMMGSTLGCNRLDYKDFTIVWSSDLKNALLISV